MIETTSSIVVKPALALRAPSSRIVRMPNSRALARKRAPLARSWIIRCNSSSTAKISKIPTRPRYPVPLHTAQPAPRANAAVAKLFTSMPNARNSRSDGTCGCLHFSQIFRTSRCAIVARNDVATRNGFTPRSINRVTAPGASFVCNVEKTICPVIDALIAISAVSKSRISPIITTFGACRSIAPDKLAGDCQHAEAFQISEYGRQPSAKELPGLFPTAALPVARHIV